jgi:hypothetical protein
MKLDIDGIGLPRGGLKKVSIHQVIGVRSKCGQVSPEGIPKLTFVNPKQATMLQEPPKRIRSVDVEVSHAIDAQKITSTAGERVTSDVEDVLRGTRQATDHSVVQQKSVT